MQSIHYNNAENSNWHIAQQLFKNLFVLSTTWGRRLWLIGYYVKSGHLGNTWTQFLQQCVDHRSFSNVDAQLS